MIKNLKAQQSPDRDGTAQEGRRQQALSPDYVAIEDRSLEALIASAQRLAKTLRFEGGSEANWEAFLLDETKEYRKKTPKEQQNQRQRWARELAAFMKDSRSADYDPEKKALMSKPHVALFLTFISLLDHLKHPMNGLVKKKLDFYFRERLGLVTKKAVPDVVHVLATLAAGVGTYSLKKGTRLLAGKDEEGNELIYALDNHTVISDAQIVEFKTVFLEKKTISLQQIIREYSDNLPQSIIRMMELALGDPKPGDPLPAFPEGVEELPKLSKQLQAGNADAANYVSQQLCMTSSDFLFIMQVYAGSQSNLNPDHDPEQWKTICRMLGSAYKSRLKKKAKFALKTIHREDEYQGFENLLKSVFGRPELDGILPEYKAKAPSLTNIYNDLTNVGNFPQQQAAMNRGEALEYIRYELCLSEKSFAQLVEAYKNPNALKPDDWEQIYALLEASKRKIGGGELPDPQADKWLGVYAESDTKATAFSRFGGDQELLQFRAFGGLNTIDNRAFQPATLGWAISSPMLLLLEGMREITVTISLDCDPVVWKTLRERSASKDQGFTPFQIALTTDEGWIKPPLTEISFGSYLLGTPESEYDSIPADVPFTKTELGKSDIGKYLVGHEGGLFRAEEANKGGVTGLKKPLELVRVGDIDGSFEHGSVWKKYTADQVYIQALRVHIKLDETDLPIAPFVSEQPGEAFTSVFPTLSLTLNEGLAHQQDSCYQLLAGLAMNKVHLNVQAEGLQEFLVQNDTSNLDPKKPFTPFGDRPLTGDSCYLAHPEITQKRFDTLSIDWQWMNTPSDFKTHYKNYWLVETGDLELEEAEYTIQNNDAFKVAVSLHEGRISHWLTDVSLFPDGGKTTIDKSKKKKAQGTEPAYTPMPEEALKPDVLDWDRYFKLELIGSDFQHERYDQILAKQVSTMQQEIAIQLREKTRDEPVFPPINPIAALTINPPYTPKLKGLSISYTAHTEMTMGEAKDAYDEVFHLHPFGYARVDKNERPSFLPVYNHEGAFFLGIENLARPQILSLLFQMVEGSADPDSEIPEVKWSYLDGNNWIPFEKASILSDTTNGLLNTGIVRLQISEASESTHTMMPPDKDWLKISCVDHLRGVPNVIDVHTQAVSATLDVSEVSSTHFLNLLDPGTISAPAEPIPQVKGFSQPYPSKRGRPYEEESWFYTRVSERLRHKNRALSIWDYEHLVLERFPEVRKVKCLPGSIAGAHGQLGCVSVIVIADIRSKMPTNPFEPKLSLAAINQIQHYLEQWTPAHTTIKVMNPIFSQVKVKMAVRFRLGYDAGHYTRELEQDVTRFLAPWAFEGDNNITLGGKMYASGLVDYVMKQPYIDFLGRVTLFQSEDGENFVEARIASGTKGLIKASRPDMALVSAQSHEISLLTEEDLRDEAAAGISHMIIEQDLMIQKKLGVTPASGIESGKDRLPTGDARGIDQQRVGVNLKVGANPPSSAS